MKLGPPVSGWGTINARKAKTLAKELEKLLPKVDAVRVAFLGKTNATDFAFKGHAAG